MGDYPLPVFGLMPSSVENVVKVIWIFVLRVIAFLAGAYFLYRVRSILISLLIAVLLTYALLPFVDRFCRNYRSQRQQKTERLIATITVFFVFILLIVTVISFMVKPLGDEIAQFTDNAAGYSAKAKVILQQATQWYANAVPDDLKDFIKKQDYSGVTKSVTEYLKGVFKATQSSLGFLMELVLIPVMAFYFVLDYRSLSREFYGLVPKKRRKEAIRLGRDAGQIFQSYVVGQLILCILAGVLTAIVLLALKMPYVIVLALFAAVTRAIPVIGPVASGVPIILVGLLNSGPELAIMLLAFVIVMHFAESKFIMPKLIGDRLHLHPAVVIIVLLIGAEFFGLIGMFLAAPVAAIARELIRLYYIQPRDRATQTEAASAPFAVV